MLLFSNLCSVTVLPLDDSDGDFVESVDMDGVVLSDDHHPLLIQLSEVSTSQEHGAAVSMIDEQIALEVLV